MKRLWVMIMVAGCATEPELAATEQHDDNACFPPMDVGCTHVAGNRWHCARCWEVGGIPYCGEVCRSLITLEIITCTVPRPINSTWWNNWRVVLQDADNRSHVWTQAEGLVESTTDPLPLEPIAGTARRAGRSPMAIDARPDGQVLLAEGAELTARVLASPGGAPFVRVADLDGDGSDELVHRAANGAVAVRFVATGAVASVATVLDPSWTLAGAGDLDGDHRDELVWRKGGELRTWRMDGARVAATTSQAVAATWALAAIADFDGDGRADLLWRDSASTARVWRSGSAQQTTASFALSPAYAVERAQDVDGDGRADLIVRSATATGVTYVSLGAPLDGAVVHSPALRAIGH